MKKFTVLLSLLFSLLFAWGVQAGGSDTIVMAWPSNVGPLNPHLYSPNQMFAQMLSYDGLVRYNGHGVEPALAESWTVSKDGKVYTFKLRKNVRFSDGTSFNADAVVENFNAIMKNSGRHDWLALINVIDSWKAIDSHTFELKLKNPYSITLIELSLPRPFRILAPSAFPDKENYSSKNIKKPIGTGPWVLTETKLGEYDIFTRNENYWGKMPEFKTLVVKVLPDANSRMIALETGEVDILIGEGILTSENYVRMKKNPKFEALKSKARATNAIALNSAKGVLINENIRIAIGHAVNKEAIVKNILLDLATVADALYSPELPYCNLNLKPVTYDLNKAKGMLETAGWKHSSSKGRQYRMKDGKILELNLHYIGTDPESKSVAEAVQADLLKAGIKLNLRAEESSIFYSLQANGNFDMIFNKTWGPPYEPGSFTSSMRKPSHADFQAQSGLADKALIDEEITKTLASVDEKSIAAGYKYILTKLHESGVYLPISYDTDLVIYNKDKIKSFKFGAMSAEFLFQDMQAATFK